MSWRVLCVLLLVTSAVAATAPDPTEPTVAGEAIAAAEATPVVAEPAEEKPENEGPKRISGMSILGNQEAPKSLVIVPWQSSEIGTSVGISTLLDDSRRPVDREVFLRALNYYEIRSETSP